MRVYNSNGGQRAGGIARSRAMWRLWSVDLQAMQRPAWTNKHAMRRTILAPTNLIRQVPVQVLAHPLTCGPQPSAFSIHTATNVVFATSVELLALPMLQPAPSAAPSYCFMPVWLPHAAHICHNISLWPQRTHIHTLFQVRVAIICKMI